MTSERPITTQVVGEAPERLEMEEAELVVVGGPDKGLRVALAMDSLRIGSGPDCEVVLHDPSVSARHAELVATPQGYFLRDLGSKNGTFLGPWPIVRVPLVDGMRFRIGRTTIKVRALGRRHSLPLHAAGMFGRLVAKSLKMRAVVAALEQLAASDTTVLIEGETGTGKEIAAEALHQASHRAQGPFIVVDCGAIAPSMMPSELFGHERGAFTGADAARQGLLEQASGGTLFLDEVGELPLDAQAMLQGALDRKTLRRVGGSVPIPFDARVVAATHRNLEEAAREGKFRSDLFFRIAVARVRMPALRERPDDLAPLAQLFASGDGVTLSPEMLAMFAAYQWPGNVRELRNTIARMAVQTEPLSLPQAGDAVPPLQEARRRAADEFERAYLLKVLALAGGQLSQAAELAGVSRQALTNLAAKHDLRARDRGKTGKFE